jgi:hypothetical protein
VLRRGGVIGGVFEQPGEGRAGAVEGGGKGDGAAERVDDRQDEVMPSSQVRSLVVEDCSEFCGLESVQSSAAHHDGSLAGRHAVGDGDRVIQYVDVIEVLPGAHQ